MLLSAGVGDTVNITPRLAGNENGCPTIFVLHVPPSDVDRFVLIEPTGNALNGVDRIMPLGAVEVPAGSSVLPVLLPIIDDRFGEIDETTVVVPRYHPEQELAVKAAESVLADFDESFAQRVNALPALYRVPLLAMGGENLRIWSAPITWHELVDARRDEACVPVLRITPPPRVLAAHGDALDAGQPLLFDIKQVPNHAREVWALRKTSGWRLGGDFPTWELTRFYRDSHTGQNARITLTAPRDPSAGEAFVIFRDQPEPFIAGTKTPNDVIDFIVEDDDEATTRVLGAMHEQWPPPMDRRI